MKPLERSELPRQYFLASVQLPCFVEEEKAGLWVGVCPIIDVASQGETKELAMRSIKEALRLFIELYDDRREPDPLGQTDYRLDRRRRRRRTTREEDGPVGGLVGGRIGSEMITITKDGVPVAFIGPVGRDGWPEMGVSKSTSNILAR